MTELNPHPLMVASALGLGCLILFYVYRAFRQRNRHTLDVLKNAIKKDRLSTLAILSNGFVVPHDISDLNPEQKIRYVERICKHKERMTAMRLIFVLLCLIIILCFILKYDSGLSSRKFEKELSSTDQKIDSFQHSKYFEERKINNPQYIKYHYGRYYMITPKNAENDSIILFPEGRYCFDDSTKFNISIDNIIKMISQSVSKNIRYNIFIQGAADGKPFKGILDANYKYRYIKYLPLFEKFDGVSFFDTSLQIDTTNKLTDSIHNENLPLLRAEYVRRKINSYRDVVKPQNLQGFVTSDTGKEFRRAKIILYIDTTYSYWRHQMK